MNPWIPLSIAALAGAKHGRLKRGQRVKRGEWSWKDTGMSPLDLKLELYEAEDALQAALKDMLTAAGGEQEDYVRVSRAIQAQNPDRIIPQNEEVSAAYLEEIQVQQRSRGRGWGTKFVRGLENDLRRRGVRMVFLVAAPVRYRDQYNVTRWTPPSWGFWRKQGYKPLVETINYKGEPLVLAYKKL